jgi:hypothetical protein
MHEARPILVNPLMSVQEILVSARYHTEPDGVERGHRSLLAGWVALTSVAGKGRLVEVALTEIGRFDGLVAPTRCS